jgi:TPR repeat protein
MRPNHCKIAALVSLSVALAFQAPPSIFAQSAKSNASEANPAKLADPEKLRSAADAGDAEAQFLLGKAYWYGTGVPMDRAKAVEIYRKAAERNHPDALAGLGAAYGIGQGVEKDEKEAADYFRRSAVLGSAAGQMNLEMMLISGKSLERDTVEGVRWMTKAAEQGFLKAQIYLGELFMVGDSGVPRDYTRARAWVGKAAEQEDGRALNLYGVILRDGLGGERDAAASVTYFRRAAEKGYVKGFLNLGSAYFFGNGIEMDKVTGMSWWFAGEELGDGACRETAVRLIGGSKPEDVARARQLGQEMARKKLPLVLKTALQR